MDTIGKDGTCGLCGNTGRTRKVKGEFCCATCMMIRQAACNHAPVMLAQVLEFHPELLGLHPPDQAADTASMTTAAACELEEARTELEKCVQRNVELVAGNTILVEKLTAAKGHNSQLADDNLVLTGELEGLQDVLSTLEGERTGLIQEQTRLTEEVRWLYQRLGAYEKQADALESEIDQLQEGTAGFPPAQKQAFMDTALARKPWTVPEDNDLAAMILTETQVSISETCDQLRSMLIDKNRAYGNSALMPLRVFSKASPQEQILVRIDDKLSRLARGSEFPGDDTVMDLAGYLVLLMVQRTNEQLEAAA